MITDFIVNTIIKPGSTTNTACTFVLWDAFNHQYHLGMEGASGKVFYEGYNAKPVLLGPKQWVYNQDNG